MVKERLLDFTRKHEPSNLPRNILFYTDGVSDSQYDTLRRRELPQIQNAFNEAYRFIHRNDGTTNLPPPSILLPDHSLQKWRACLGKTGLTRRRTLRKSRRRSLKRSRTM